MQKNDIESKAPEEGDRQNVARKTGLVYAAVLSFFSAVLVCLLVGWGVDRWLGTGPWFVVGGIVLGSAVGFYEFIRIISRVS